jgi:Transglutaminase-like superfamily/Domain of unknown function (DUF4129)
VAADSAPTRLRYVSLDHFDGQYWTRTADYRRAGRRLPVPAGQGATESREERVAVLRAGPLGWLLSSGRPVEVSVPDLGVNTDTGDVVIPDDQPVPAGYTVRSVRPDPTLAELEAAETTPWRRTGGPDDAGDPAAVPELGTEARTATGDAYGYGALVRLERHFTGGRYTVDERPEARAGHGFYQVRQLLRSRTGTAEQFASAYALMARAMDYNARVVVGFRPGPKAAGAYSVTGRNVHAWVEVEFAGLGWIPFDPTPRLSSDQPETLRPEPEPTPTPTPSSEPTQTPSTPGSTPSCPPPCEPSQAEPGPGPGRTGLLAGAGITALVLAAVFGVPVLKALRRRRRRRTMNPDRRALAAWRDLLDSLAEAGLTVPASHTSGQVADAAAGRFGTDRASSVRRLARLRDDAVYGPVPITAYAADSAWQHADTARQAVRGSLGRLRAVRALLDPRPLLTRPGTHGAHR